MKAYVSLSFYVIAYFILFQLINNILKLLFMSPTLQRYCN